MISTLTIPINSHKRIRVFLFVLILLLSACSKSPNPSDQFGIRISPPQSGGQEINYDSLYRVSQNEIEKTLPGAIFIGAVFSSSCEDLPRLRGTLVLTFAQVRQALLGEQIYWGIATLDTSERRMNLEYIDASNSYPRTKAMPSVNHEQIQRIVEIAETHIKELHIPNCDVTITQLDEKWDIRCGKLTDATQKCHFEIENGRVLDLPKE